VKARLPWTIGDLSLMVVGVIGASMSGPLMAAAAAPALAIAFWRTGLAAGALTPTVVMRQRPQIRDLRRREWRLCLLAGLMLAGHFATWASALKITSVASATALVCSQVGWVVVLSRLTGAPVPDRVVAGLVLALAGVLVVSGVDFSLSLRSFAGDGLALAGGLFGAVYVMIGGEVRRTVNTTVYVFVCYSACAVVLLLICLAFGQALTGYDSSAWLRILAVTVVAQLVGHSVVNHLLVRISPAVISLVFLLEVPGAALLASVFLGQSPPLGVYGGLMLVLAGLAIVVMAPTSTTLGVEGARVE
jgi:drug/metabolite transporter (DMT)-like permease